MELLTVSKARARFGSVLSNAQTEPVQISKNGQPAAVVISVSDYDESDIVMTKLLQMRSDAADLAEKEGRLINAEDFEKKLMAREY